MNFDQFFEKFELLSETPNAVGKTRELILHLAVRGKLVPQNPSEGDGREMIVRARQSREKTIRDKNLRKKQIDEGSELERREDLPANWHIERLANLVEPEQTISYGVLVPGNDVSDGISFVRAQDLCLKDHPTRPNKTIAPEIERPYARTRLTGGEILLCVVGSIGKLGTVPESWAGANIARAVARIRPIEEVFRDYLLIVLQDSAVQSYFRSTTRTLAQPTLNVSLIEQTPIPVPPLAEQKRIVAKVDELMALCDRLEAQQKERETQKAALVQASLTRFTDAPTPTNLEFLFHKSYAVEPDELRNCLLALAAQGRLISQCNTDEPASAVLMRLELQGGNSSVRRSVPTEVRKTDFVEDENLPESWASESTARLLHLGAIIDLKDGNHGANHPKVAEFTETGLPFITAAQVSDDGSIDYDGAYKVSGEALARLRVGFAQPGDVIYTHKGSVGRVAICTRECVLTPQTTYYRPNSEILTPGFLRIFLLSSYFRSQVDQVKRQTTRDFVSINAQYQFFLRIPPLAEQKHIVAKVDELMALVDKLAAQLAASRKAGAKLLEAVVAEIAAAA